MAEFEPAKAQLSSSTKTGARQRQLSTSEASYLDSKVVVALYSAGLLLLYSTAKAYVLVVVG